MDMTSGIISLLKKSLVQPARRIEDRSLARAAVLIPLVQTTGGLHLLLTKRTETVEQHKGQISFPGGSVESSDSSLVGTALREATEEIGLYPSDITVLGVMDDLKAGNGFIISPVIGYVERLPSLSPNPDEVAEIILIAFHDFLNDTKRYSRIMQRNRTDVEVFFYDVWKEPVWGITGLLIKNLIDIIRSVEYRTKIH